MRIHMSRDEPKTATRQPHMNGSKGVIRALPRRVDDMPFELAQHRKLLVKITYGLWIGERFSSS